MSERKILAPEEIDGFTVLERKVLFHYMFTVNGFTVAQLMAVMDYATRGSGSTLALSGEYMRPAVKSLEAKGILREEGGDVWRVCATIPRATWLKMAKFGDDRRMYYSTYIALQCNRTRRYSHWFSARTLDELPACVKLAELFGKRNWKSDAVECYAMVKAQEIVARLAGVDVLDSRSTTIPAPLVPDASVFGQYALAMMAPTLPEEEKVTGSELARAGLSSMEAHKAVDDYEFSLLSESMKKVSRLEKWVKQLVGRLPAEKKAVKKAQGTICWRVTLGRRGWNRTNYAGTAGPWGVKDVRPAYRAPGGSPDGSGDKLLQTTVFSRSAGKKYEAIMTPLDNRIAALLLKQKEKIARRSTVPKGLMELLSEHQYVTVETDEDDGKPVKPRMAGVKVCREYVKTKKAGGGEVEFSAPEWFGKIEWNRVCESYDDFCFFLSPTVLEYVPDGRAAAEVKLILLGKEKVARGEKLKVTKEEAAGAAEFVELTDRCADLDAERESVLRIGFSGECLEITLLAGERATKEVRAALKAWEDWFDGVGSWRISDLAEALAATDAVKGLEGVVKLEWEKGAKLKVMKPMKFASNAVGGTDWWFKVKGKVTLDDGRAMDLVKLLRALPQRKGEFVPFGDGEYLRLTMQLVKRLEALRAAGQEKGGGLEVSPAALPMLDRAFAGDDGLMALPENMAAGAESIRKALAKPVEPPERLQATLRTYQADGYEWMARLANCGIGACLADDMGLGKTLQTIALLLERAKDGPSLVAAPASVCGNWRRELRRFAPSLNPVMAWEDDAEGSRGLVAKAKAGDVVIAGYGLLVSREEQFTGKEWNGAVLDEAQAIKNAESKRAKAAKALKAKFRIAATGTPVENRLGELWSIFGFLNPGLLGTEKQFTDKYVAGGRPTPALKQLVQPLILRRLKGDVLDDLPEKTEITMQIELGEKEREAYEACRVNALKEISSGEDNMRILAELMRLRRFCCHPDLVMPGFGESAKLEALEELLESLKTAGHRALVFSQFTDYLAIVRDLVERRGWSAQYLDGSVGAKDREARVDAFQHGEGDFFLISLKAGGTGLNLTAANYVIILDPWWNPAVEDQAADRAHRIGQKNPVTVYRLIASDTVEERVLALHGEKRAISGDLLEGTGSTTLSHDELMKLFR